MGSRTGLNFVVDAIAFIGFTLLVSTGVVLHYLLPPGSGHRLAIWGLGRHDWGEIHFVISLLFLVVLSVHILIHWRWVFAVAKGRASRSSGRRLLLGIIGLLALIALAMAPILSPVTSTGGKAEARGKQPRIR